MVVGGGGADLVVNLRLTCFSRLLSDGGRGVC